MATFKKDFLELLAESYSDPILGFLHTYHKVVQVRGQDHFAINKKGEITFLNPTRQEDGVSVWTSPQRQAVAAGRALRKMVPLAYTDVQFDNAAAMIRSHGDNGTFEIVYGQGVIELYRRDAIVGVTSCMTDQDALLQFYAANSPAVGLLVARDDTGRPLGRALIWSTNNGYYVDHVYASSSAVRKRYDRWVKENGHYTSSRPSKPTWAIMPNMWPANGRLPSLDTVQQNATLRCISIGGSGYPSLGEVMQYLAEKTEREDFRSIPTSVMEWFGAKAS